ncbi:hypothetical protein ABZX85_46155 [Streptomyces sp. NPDC004539]|uniref:hypothetical protein n=1 Tax=Streptomyces sp. NPDC004539 TaxID=3154280 RepID=UPI0033A991E3
MDPTDIGELIPLLAPLALRTTVLSPTTGTPGPRESSVGGPLLWPSSEEWPRCGQRGHWLPPDDKRVVGEVPMVPVVQLFARDVPELEFPEGADVLQLVWCTLNHPADSEDSVLPRLYWRDEAAVLAGGLLLDVPVPQEGEERLGSPYTDVRVQGVPGDAVRASVRLLGRPRSEMPGSGEAGRQPGRF